MPLYLKRKTLLCILIMSMPNLQLGIVIFPLPLPLASALLHSATGAVLAFLLPVLPIHCSAMLGAEAKLWAVSDFTAAEFGRWGLVRTDCLGIGLTQFLVQFISELCILTKCSVCQESFTKDR